jgi:dUTP pyrophosphatase
MHYLYLKCVNQELLTYYNEIKGYRGDAGINIYNSKIEKINDNQYIIDTEIQCEMLYDKKNVSYFIVPRSSISKTPFRMSNSIGIIDSGYRGNLKMYVDSLDGSEPELNKSYFQIITPTLDTIWTLLVEQLSSSERGENGFGSTSQ